MKQFFSLLAFTLLVQMVQAQKLYFYSGQNQSTYDFNTSAEEDSQPFLKRDNGYYFEVGFELDFSKSWIYRAGVSYNQFNNKGGDEINYLAWESSYLGLQNVIGYTLFKRNTFRSLVSAGVGISTIVDGSQQINNSFNLLKNQENFKGVFIAPELGLELRYKLMEMAELSLRFSHSKSFNLKKTKENSQELSFGNNQLALGIHIPLAKSKNEEKKQEDVAQIQKDLLNMQKSQNNLLPKMDSLVKRQETAMKELGMKSTTKTVIQEFDKHLFFKEQINSGYIAAYFDTNKSHPTSASAGAINYVLTYLRNNPNATIKIFGNSDEIGNLEYNKKLAFARANNIHKVLVAAGIQENRILVVLSNGEDSSVDRKSRTARSLVRKVTFQIE